MFPKIGVKPTKWMVYFMENPIEIDDLGGFPLFLGLTPHPYRSSKECTFINDLKEPELQCSLRCGPTQRAEGSIKECSLSPKNHRDLAILEWDGMQIRHLVDIRKTSSYQNIFLCIYCKSTSV